jgi:hypothetical protein
VPGWHLGNASSCDGCPASIHARLLLGRAHCSRAPSRVLALLRRGGMLSRHPTHHMVACSQQLQANPTCQRRASHYRKSGERRKKCLQCKQGASTGHAIHHAFPRSWDGPPHAGMHPHLTCKHAHPVTVLQLPERVHVDTANSWQHLLLAALLSTSGTPLLHPVWCSSCRPCAHMQQSLDQQQPAAPMFAAVICGGRDAPAVAPETHRHWASLPAAGPRMQQGACHAHWLLPCHSQLPSIPFGGLLLIQQAPASTRCVQQPWLPAVYSTCCR